MGDNNLYTGAEAGTVWNGSSPEPDTLFLIHPPGVPLSAVPIFDEENHAIIGFRHGSGGVYRIYDLCGNLSGMEEEPLQTPLFDPIDLIFLGYGLLRGIGRAGGRTGETASWLAWCGALPGWPALASALPWRRGRPTCPTSRPLPLAA